MAWKWSEAGGRQMVGKNLAEDGSGYEVHQRGRKIGGDWGAYRFGPSRDIEIRDKDTGEYVRTVSHRDSDLIGYFPTDGQAVSACQDDG